LLQLTYFTELDWAETVLKIEQLTEETLQLKEVRITWQEL